ncbi:MAG: hypothetical protein D6788_09070 [Planctomycetota bacterium]|nr:MAG: hypothetical protein D6788_09070 [Planctomycetota bacterium]
MEKEVEVIPWRKVSVLMTLKAYTQALVAAGRFGCVEVSALGLVPEDDVFPQRIIVRELLFPKQTGGFLYTIPDPEDVKSYLPGPFEWKDGRRMLARVFLHTHADEGLEPSEEDWIAFHALFGDQPWSVMMIMDRQGATSAYLTVGLRPRLVGQVDARVDVTLPTEAVCPDEVEEQIEKVMRQAPFIAGTLPNPEEYPGFIKSQEDERELASWADELGIPLEMLLARAELVVCEKCGKACTPSENEWLCSDCRSEESQKNLERWLNEWEQAREDAKPQAEVDSTAGQ